MSMNFVRAIQFTHDAGLARAATIPILFDVARRTRTHGAGHDLIRLREQHRRGLRIGKPERHATGGHFPR
jgi:hypothetical protein